jgi:hypothetical protein
MGGKTGFIWLRIGTSHLPSSSSGRKTDLHFCVDYGKLDVTKKDCFILPRIDDTLDTLTGAKWFSTLDVKSGYWQMVLHTDDREKTGFSMGQGL